MSTPLVRLFQDAIRQHKAGRLADAERLYRAVLQQQPGHADANHNLGVLAITAGKADLSLPWLKAALQASPEQAQYWVSYIDALIRVGRATEARSVLAEGRRHGLQGAIVDELAARVLAMEDQAAEPTAQEIDSLIAAHREGRLADAERLSSAFTARFPRHPLGWSVMGGVRQRQLRFDDALAALQQVRALAPSDVGAHLQLADLLARLGRFDRAEAVLAEAIALDSGHAMAHVQRAAALQALGRLDEAETCCRRALELQPGLFEAHGTLGLVLRGLGRLDAAEESLRLAIGVRPEHAGTHANLAAILIDRGNMSRAEASCRQAIALQPKLAQAHVNLGVALIGLGRFREAVEACRQALSLWPGHAEARSNLLFALNFMAEVTPEAALAEALVYGHEQRQKVRQAFESWTCSTNPRKLRVGFVSGDLRAHPVGYFMHGLLQGLGAPQLELVAYPTVETEDALTAVLKPHFTGWHPLVGLDDGAAARRIHDDGIHVLIDLAGHTALNRLPVFVHRPAPVQVAWLGYFATTGLREIDFVLGDPFVTPPREAGHFVETVWRMPESYLCFAAPAFDIPVNELPARRNGHLTFGCFNSLSKVNDACLALWARVMHAVPDSRLLLKAGQLADPQVIAMTRSRFEKLGIAGGRLTFEGPSPRRDYLEAYHRVDVSLDPFPFPGGTTTVEGLWMGVPVLTKRGDRFIGHNGETIAQNAGQANWIAGDDDDLVAKAVGLTSDLDRLALIRSGLRRQVLSSRLFDSKRFAGHFEQALWAMWEARRKGVRNLNAEGSR